MTIYYKDDWVTLHLGDARELIPTLGRFDACITDPPYGQTPLAWDSWVAGWPRLVTQSTNSLWCFGTVRMFLSRGSEFSDWKFSQDIVWAKAHATSRVTDRFRRRHEMALHFYRGMWRDIHHDLPKRAHYGPRTKSPTRNDRYTPGSSTLGRFSVGQWEDDGRRYMDSVIEVANVPPVLRRKMTINPTQKPERLLTPLIQYSCPPGGVVLDPFAGSGSTATAARAAGRRAVIVEASEEQCARTAARLAQADEHEAGSEVAA